MRGSATGLPSALRSTLPVSSSKVSCVNATPATSAWLTAPVAKRAVRSVWLVARAFSVWRR